MSITEERRDLFSLNHMAEYSLCHCVSADLAMGKGIAVLFRDKFGGIAELRAQNPQVGSICALASGSQRIYYLITKPKYWDKPTYETLESSLVRMRDDMLSRGLTRIGMPKIGCGLDGLDWAKVRPIIERVFKTTGIEVLICIK